ncbi:MAG: hypothetical protein CMF87_05995 [Candidatus Marinimicrobia bacterium]|nr:hypothetical protein [Candidatus Neomarinimicrobiota bacterium]
MENNKILKYLEGQLSDQDKKDFEALIESNSDLQLEVEMLGNLIDNEPAEIPPYELRQKIYQMANIKDETFMDVAIKKVDSILEVVIGNQYQLDVEPLLITRSSNSSKIFSKDMNDYEIVCDISNELEDNFLINLAVSKNQKAQENIKFSVTQNQKTKNEFFTKSNGNTGSFKLNSGQYLINISTLKFELGNIKINLS